MAANQTDGTPPLYLHVVRRILRDMRVAQQETRDSFVYGEFKRQLMAAELTATQLGPLNQRLETLESFMLKSQVNARGAGHGKKAETKDKGNSWTPKVCLSTYIKSCTIDLYSLVILRLWISHARSSLRRQPAHYLASA
jgi:hypothetical protein